MVSKLISSEDRAECEVPAAILGQSINHSLRVKEDSAPSHLLTVIGTAGPGPLSRGLVTHSLGKQSHSIGAIGRKKPGMPGAAVSSMDMGSAGMSPTDTYSPSTASGP